MPLDPAPAKGEPLGFVYIGVLKFGTALLLAAAGFGIFRLMGHDLGATMESFARRLHLDPGGRFLRPAIARVTGIDRAQLEALGVVTLCYAALELAEGVGLMLRKRWAGYLTAIATGLLLIPEGFEIARKPDLLRVGVLLANLAILLYLVAHLVREARARRASEPRRAGGP